MSTTPSPVTSPALQAPKPTQPMISPDGTHGDIPVERVQDAIKAGFKPALDMVSPDGSVGSVPVDRAHEAMKSGFKVSTPDMNTSKIPDIARAGANLIPPVAGMAGAVLGAPAFGFGSVVGAGLGTGAGISFRQALLNKAFGEGPSPVSKQGLRDVGIGAGVGAALEVPGAIAQGYGSFLLKRLAAAKDSNQVGDVIEAFRSVAPKGFTANQLKNGLDAASEQLTPKLTNALSGSTTTINIDNILSPIRSQAAIEDLSFRGGKRVSNAVEDIIAAAKSEAGIKGNTANAQQLANFQRSIQDVAYKISSAKPGPGTVAKSLMDDVYKTTGNSVRMLAPDAGPILDQMSDLHAARNALKNYAPGVAKSIAISAATNPRTAAALSPLTPIAATEAPKVVRRITDFVR